MSEIDPTQIRNLDDPVTTSLREIYGLIGTCVDNVLSRVQYADGTPVELEFTFENPWHKAVREFDSEKQQEALHG